MEDHGSETLNPNIVYLKRPPVSVNPQSFSLTTTPTSQTFSTVNSYRNSPKVFPKPLTTLVYVQFISRFHTLGLVGHQDRSVSPMSHLITYSLYLRS